jgi:hypothetical protein
MQTFSFPPAGLTEEEEQKAGRIDQRLFAVLVTAGITDRWTWRSDATTTPRQIELRFLIPNTAPVVTFTPDRFLALSDDDVIAQVQVAIARF